MNYFCIAVTGCLSETVYGRKDSFQRASKASLYLGKGGNRAVVADGGEDDEKEAFGEAQGVCVCVLSMVCCL